MIFTLRNRSYDQLAHAQIAANWFVKNGRNTLPDGTKWDMDDVRFVEDGFGRYSWHVETGEEQLATHAEARESIGADTYDYGNACFIRATIDRALNLLAHTLTETRSSGNEAATAHAEEAYELLDKALGVAKYLENDLGIR